LASIGFELAFAEAHIAVFINITGFDLLIFFFRPIALSRRLRALFERFVRLCGGWTLRLQG
jgi:hypothetical protein